MKNKKIVDKYKPPESDSKDTVHLVAKAVLSFVPGASDLFEYFVAPPMQKRLEKWQQEISQALLYLEENQGVKLEELQSNEQFITIVAQATTIAIRTHQKEKLVALKNVIVNSASSPKTEEDLQLIFIRFVDELTPSHLYLLRFFINNEDKIKFLKSYPSIYQLVSENISDTPSKDRFKMLIGDLSVRGLIHVSQDIDDFEEIYQASSILLEETNDDLPRLIITDIAKEFIDFISNHNKQ
jgi:hypothetical protein